MTVARQDLAAYDETARCLTVSGGTYKFLIGASSTDIRQRAVIRR